MLTNDSVFMYLCTATINVELIEGVYQNLKNGVIEETSYQNSTLVNLKEKDYELFRIGCCLDNYLVNASVTGTEKKNTCASLNYWINKKKSTYIGDSTLSGKVTLWDELEKLWYELQKSSGEDTIWCQRDLNLYEYSYTSRIVSVSSLQSLSDIIIPVLFPVIITFIVFLIIFNFTKIKRSFNKNLSKRTLIRKDIQGTYPLGPSGEDITLDLKKKRINIVYASKKNS
ncbi:variable surface protein [Plasmodium gonderi]|uniref:Variable surface protein n=1 Tax=Plasmodium gonderi TaxID=77519 RepID=A0A1Y1JDK7_PLAGO|nr:variable surface protein [Plasmodium gonderi]GAW79405.1 variable surface protein [Plasmodium gonderi]